MKRLLTVLLLGGAVLSRADEIEPAVDTSSVAPAPATTESAPASEPARSDDLCGACGGCARARAGLTCGGTDP